MFVQDLVALLAFCAMFLLTGEICSLNSILHTSNLAGSDYWGNNISSVKTSY